MYDHIEDVLVNDNKIQKTSKLLWLNIEGEIVDEMNAYGMKTTIEIFRPDMALTCDEVRCNLTMENDGCR